MARKKSGNDKWPILNLPKAEKSHQYLLNHTFNDFLASYITDSDFPWPHHQVLGFCLNLGSVATLSLLLSPAQMLPYL